MRLPLVFYGDPRLRKKSQPVTKITDELLKLADDMLDTMDINHGVGLAAPQIGQTIRFFILRNHIVTPEGHIQLTDPQAYINPKITILSSEEMQTDIEGCLSIPGIHEEVERPLKIRVEAMGLNGEIFVEEIEGYKARVVMHENDHINGVLFIDRISADKRKKLEPILREIKKKYHAAD